MFFNHCVTVGDGEPWRLGDMVRGSSILTHNLSRIGSSYPEYSIGEAHSDHGLRQQRICSAGEFCGLRL